MSKKILIILFLLFSSFQVFSQEADENFDQEEPTDTLSDYYYEDELMDIEDMVLDSTAMAFNDWFFSKSYIIYNFKAPGQDIYKIWDTVFVHPYKFDLAKKTDTTFVVLRDNFKGVHYSPPYIGAVTSNFGFRRYRYHYGIDLGLKIGDTIRSCFDGMVRVVKKSKSYGNVVVIRHNNTLETVYAHLEEADVKTNQVIKAGEIIGLGGNTGRSTGPHLHFEVRYLGQPINPTDVFDFQNQSALKSDILAISKTTFSYLREARKTKYYTIRKGDSLGRIARKFGVSLKRLSKMNRIKSTTRLRVGRRIRIR